MIKRALYMSLLLAVLFYFGSCGRPSEQLRSDSKIEDRVIDSADLLSSVQEENIFRLIQGLEKSVGSQIAVVIINTLNGVLITVAYQDRKTRIEVGYGLEKILKDEVTAQIVREQMLPKFKEQKVYEGIYESVSTIKKLIEENKKLVGQKP